MYGANYKVSNLHNMYRHAKYDVIVLADSDIRVGPELSRRASSSRCRTAQAGLVTCIYRADQHRRPADPGRSRCSSTPTSPTLVMLARKVEKSSYAFGATIAMRREVLDEIGGFLPIANLLADDYELGYRASQRGYVG